VAAFLGRERGLKRLALLTVADVELGDPIDVAASADADEARAVMARHGVDWIGVHDGGRLLGWAWARDLDGVVRVADAPLHPFRVTVSRSTSLREVLDVIVTSRTRVAAVVDDGRYVGMLGLDRLAEGIR
jgi:osmoprotectant transport system ATP-binding protein